MPSANYRNPRRIAGTKTEMVPVSEDELQTTVTGLKDKAEGIIVRIERLKEKQQQS
jgi:hypothetical protein